ncbi:aspartyl/glutamyl-tRNA(Asn/Gln) amidotransferase, C subunit [Phialophora macrospora]|uniref:Aspartyl/glutamyl-tRNA(Asn/Gln) amidotransferase, C subunit n=1 Tax=Phialophora macrospora TaxID=1851006 RepID=A0A0D2DLC2_9EURO|nr:aspartyl/glutamyl-tRNA(Asn/Gln) amidotransferase, C subunit [Phialophora macrospora]
MPRLPRQTFSIRTAFYGPVTSPSREKEVRLVKKIDLSPDIESLLETPTWSVASLLPPAPSRREEPGGSDSHPWRRSTPAYEAETENEISRDKLHHLLKLSALPLPKSEAEENEMLHDLRDQVHFVKEIQKVDTTGVQPLVAIRDETSEHRREQTITREKLAEYLALEEKKGKNGTIRRRKDSYLITSFSLDSQPWMEDPIAWSKVEDPWAMGEGAETRRMGRFFFVKRRQADPVGQGKDKNIEDE